MVCSTVLVIVHQYTPFQNSERFTKHTRTILDHISQCGLFEVDTTLSCVGMLQPTAGTSLSITNLERYIDALKLLEQCLTEVCCDQQDMLKGLCIFLHHPDNTSAYESKVSACHLALSLPCLHG